MSYSSGVMNSISTLSPHEPVLVRLPNWVGDVCMCLPVLRLLESSGIPFAICARPWAQDLLSGLKLLDFIPAIGKHREDLKVLRQWRLQHPEVKRALLMPDSLSTALIFWLAGFKSAGYRDDGRSLLLSWPVNKPVPRPHAVQSWFGLAHQTLQRWAVQPARAEPEEKLNLPLTQTHRQLATQMVIQAGLGSTEFVLIAPTAVGRHHGQIKVWPFFDALTKTLQAQGHRVVMCPPPAERADALLAAPTAELLPALGLGAFCALTNLARLVICNDSGVSHLCAAAGARQLTLFGVTDPARTGPWTPNSINLGQNGHWPAAQDATRYAQQILSSLG